MKERKRWDTEAIEDSDMRREIKEKKNEGVRKDLCRKEKNDDDD